MSDKKEPYKLSIKEGEVRVVISIEDIAINVRNTAKEFVTEKDDHVFLFLSFNNLDLESLRKEGYELSLFPSDDSSSTKFSLKKESIWFDVAMEEMKSLLNNTLQFSIKGEHPNHINYFIKNLDYKIEWLQNDKNSESVSTLSVTKKSFSQSNEEIDVSYKLDEISNSAEQLNRAIKKIDLRTGSAYVRLNSEDGKFDPIMISIAENLGYQLKVLDEETISELKKSGRKATHFIALTINY